MSTEHFALTVPYSKAGGATDKAVVGTVPCVVGCPAAPRPPHTRRQCHHLQLRHRNVSTCGQVVPGGILTRVENRCPTALSWPPASLTAPSPGEPPRRFLPERKSHPPCRPQCTAGEDFVAFCGVFCISKDESSG